MKPLNEQTKEELLTTVTEVLDKVNNYKPKIEHLDAFYNSTIVGADGQPSTQARIQNVLDQAQAEGRLIEGLKNNLVAYSNEIFTDAESKLSLRTNLGNFLNKIKEDSATVDGIKNTISEYSNELFKDVEGRVSLKNQVTAMVTAFETDAKKLAEIKANMEAFSAETLVGTAATESTKAKLEALVTSTTAKINEILAFHKKILVDDGGKPPISEQLEEAFDETIAAHAQLLVGDAKSPALKTQITELHGIAGVVEKEVQATLAKLKAFQSEVFDNPVNDLGEEQQGLRKSAETLKVKLSTLIQQATDKLHALTDSSLHNSFYSRAEKYSEEYERLQKYTFAAIFGICGVTIVFAIIQLINVYGYDKSFSYNLEFYQLGITLPIVYAIWMLNRNQKIAKKLAEEYHHKAALAEAMTGYRALYQLQHDSPEYMNLFNGIKEQLNNNPSTTIDKFLNLKSPTENIIKESSKIMNPETVAAAVGVKVSGK